MHARMAGEEKAAKSVALCVNQRFGDEKIAKKRGPVSESASPETRKLACPRRLVGAVSERARSGLGAGTIGTA